MWKVRSVFRANTISETAKSEYPANTETFLLAVVQPNESIPEKDRYLNFPLRSQSYPEADAKWSSD